MIENLGSERTAPARRVFLSYAHRQNTVDPERLFGDLERHGHRVWWDRDALGDLAGDATSAMLSGVASSGCVLALVDPHALRSPFVRAEWEHALSLGRPILPVLFAGVRLPSLLSGHVPLSVGPERGYEALVSNVLRRLAVPSRRPESAA